MTDRIWDYDRPRLNLCCLTQPGRTPSFTSLAAASAILKARANALFAPSRGNRCGVHFVPRTCRAPRSRSSFLHFFGARSRSCDDLL